MRKFSPHFDVASNYRISPMKVPSTPRVVDPLSLWFRIKYFNQSSLFGDWTCYDCVVQSDCTPFDSSDILKIKIKQIRF